MDIQAYLRKHFSNKKIILVGNAQFGADRSHLIDSHDLVLRFNIFNNISFQQGKTGSRMDYWCVNLVRKGEGVVGDELCRYVKKSYPGIPVITPSYGKSRLNNRKKIYSEFEFIYPDKQLDTGLTTEPTTGYSLTYLLTSLSIPISIIGFTGETSKWHDGPLENHLIRNNSLVTFHETP